MRHLGVWIALSSLFTLMSCATASVIGLDRHPSQVGVASFYTHQPHARTASGKPYDDRKLTAAHRTLPFGTRVRVTNLDNHRSVVLTINDRGPYRRGRIIDVSRRASRVLGFHHDGLARVRVVVMKQPRKHRRV